MEKRFDGYNLILFILSILLSFSGFRLCKFYKNYQKNFVFILSIFAFKVQTFKSDLQNAPVNDKIKRV